MGEEPLSSRLRKRQRVTAGTAERMDQLLELMEKCHKVVVFTGSGLSATSGMSMFSTKNGLYERARRQFKIQDGIRLFSYSFYKQRRADVQAFFAQIYSEAQASQAARGHHALAQLHQLGRLQRHYTLNIDGLAEVVGMDSWHHKFNPAGITVEMHGNIRDVVCPSCHAVEQLNRGIINTMKQKQPVNCNNCSEGEVRFKVMLYDDEEGDCITPEDVWEVLEQDLASADAVVWLGISFEQSASTEYFRKVRYMLQCAGRLAEVPQILINPSEDALFNLMSSCAKKEDIEVLEILESSDDVLPKLVDHLQSLHLGGGSKQRTSRSPPQQQQQQEQQQAPRQRPWRKQYSEEFEAGHQEGDEEPPQEDDTDSEEQELHRWWKKQNGQQGKEKPGRQQQQRRRTPSVKQEVQSVQQGRQQQQVQVGPGAGAAARAAPSAMPPVPCGGQQPLLQQLLLMSQGQQLLQHLASQQQQQQQQAVAAVGAGHGSLSSVQWPGMLHPGVTAAPSVQLATAAALQAMQQHQHHHHHQQHKLGLSAVLAPHLHQQQQGLHPAAVSQQPIAAAAVPTVQQHTVQASAGDAAADDAAVQASAAAGAAPSSLLPPNMQQQQQQQHIDGEAAGHHPREVNSNAPAVVHVGGGTAQEVQPPAAEATPVSTAAGQVQVLEQPQAAGALQQAEIVQHQEQQQGHSVDQQQPGGGLGLINQSGHTTAEVGGGCTVGQATAVPAVTSTVTEPRS